MAAVAVVALVAAGCSDDGGDTETGVGVLAGGSIRLEPATARQPDPFTDGDLDPVVASGAAIALPDVEKPPFGEATTGDGLARRRTAGDAAGLYGGSLDTAVCDTDQLVAFHSDPASAGATQAFAQVQGISPDQVVDYIRGLAPVRLRVDTRVTNHGLVDGQASPFQSVLQAGTAVLVDAAGVPRVRCFCGNPLVEPRPVEAPGGDTGGLIENPDDRWEGFDPDEVVTVEPGSVAEGLIVVDLETGQPTEMPVDPSTGNPSPPPTPSTPGGAEPSTTATTARPTDTPGGGGGGSSGTICTRTPEQVICRAD